MNQNIISLRETDLTKVLNQVIKSGYVEKDSHGTLQVILLASGLEVSSLLKSAALLEKDNISVRVVSVPSEGLYRSQSTEYPLSVLLNGIPGFCLTA